MKNYKITFGTGTAWTQSKIIQAEEWETESDAIGKLIDILEEEGNEGNFLKWEETTEEGGEYYEDEYIIGGNHGRIFIHYGTLFIEEVENETL